MKKETINLADKVVFYSKSYSKRDIDSIRAKVSSTYSQLKVYTRTIQIHSDSDIMPQLDIFEALIVIPDSITKKFYNDFHSLGVFLRNEELINPIKEI